MLSTWMVYKYKKTEMPQIALLCTQFLFLIVLVGGFYLISRASFTAYERSLSPLFVEGAMSSLYDWLPHENEEKEIFN